MVADLVSLICASNKTCRCDKYHHFLLSYRTKEGVHYHEDMETVTAPSAMFVKSLEILLDKMAAEGFDFSTVVAVGGDAQVLVFLHFIKYIYMLE